MLEQIYGEEITKPPFFERKCHIPENSVIIQGPPRSGKTFLIYDYLQRFKKGSYLYIDLEDFRIDLAEVAKELHLFVATKKIDLLVIENMDPRLTLPSVRQIILSTRKPLRINGFGQLRVWPLDFEEYISFDKKHQNIPLIFNNFLQNGTFAEMIFVPECSKTKRLQEIMKLTLSDPLNLRIFKQFAINMGQKISAFQLFGQLKQEIKLSKDTFYASVDRLKEEGFVYFVQKHDQPRAAKKVYLVDFALKSAFTFKKEFPRMFENMVFLELLKKGKEVLYSDAIDFFLPEEPGAVLCMPFVNQELLLTKWDKIAKNLRALGLTSATIVTVGSDFVYQDRELLIQALPFYEWALLEEL